jgi:hypothetical protein
MAETAVVQPVRSRRVTLLVGLVVVGLATVAITDWISGLERSPGWSGPAFGLITAGLVAAVMVLTRSWRDRSTWVAALGLALIAAGSGIARPRTEILTGDVGSETGSGEVIGRLDTWWVLVGVGLVLAAGAFIWALQSSKAAPRRTLATGSLLAVGVGFAIVAVVMRDLVVGQWISGRPLRGRHRRAAPARHHGDHASAGDLWRDAAADEAEAVVAFTCLAERLTRAGGPVPLIDRCHEAAREEQRHAASCERLASRLGSSASVEHASASAGRPSCAVRPVDERRTNRTSEILRLATESFVDGVVGEGFAARRLEAGSATVSGRDGLGMRSMAREERNHAALGADIVEWALEQHPLLVRGALRSAARRLPVRTETPAPVRAFPPEDLRRVGMVDAPTADELWAEQRTAALRWLDEMLASQGSERLPHRDSAFVQ